MTACHACAAPALLILRTVPYTSTRTLFDTTPKDILTCATHIQAARQIGTVVRVTQVVEP